MMVPARNMHVAKTYQAYKAEEQEQDQDQEREREMSTSGERAETNYGETNKYM